MNTILAIDPGARTGWALLAGPTYRGGAVGWSIQWFTGALKDATPDLVICEDTFQHHGGKTNVATKAMMDRRIGAVITLAYQHGLPVVRVPPTSWQSPMFGGKFEREQGKKLSVLVARQRVSPMVRDDDNAADAALMALWARGV